MINVRELHFAFKASDFALTVPSLDVAAGERVAVVGPSGSGKTTLLNLIAGILSADRGEIEIDGTRLDKLDDAGRRSFRLGRLGMVFQNFELIDYLSVLENILLPCRIGGALRLDSGTRDRARMLATLTGIGDKLQKFPRNLSQGERQRTAICRALLAKPKLILADEATGNLDPANKRVVLDALFDQAKSNGAAILAVTHDHELLPAFDRTIDFREFLGAIP